MVLVFNPAMSIPNQIRPDQTNASDQRLTNLEIKAIYTEDLLEQLDAVIVRQQKQINQLQDEVSRLRESLTSNGSSNGEFKNSSLRSELPPHF